MVSQSHKISVEEPTLATWEHSPVHLRSNKAIRFFLALMAVGPILFGVVGVLSSMGRLPEPIFSASYDWMIAIIAIPVIWLTRNIFRMQFILDSSGIRSRGFFGKDTHRNHDQIRGVIGGQQYAGTGLAARADNSQYFIIDHQGTTIANLSPNWLGDFEKLLPWIAQLDRLTLAELKTLRSPKS
jgi:hypothetical protein